MVRTAVVFTVAAVLLVGFVVEQAPARGEKLTLRVVADLGTLDIIKKKGPGATFYVTGDICADPTAGAACTAVGKFDCWGWMVGDAAGTVVVAQEWNIFDRGKIALQGVEDAGPRPITGGTGEFKNARGEAKGFDFANFPPEFIGEFKVIGAKK